MTDKKSFNCEALSECPHYSACFELAFIRLLLTHFTAGLVSLFCLGVVVGVGFAVAMVKYGGVVL